MNKPLLLRAGIAAAATALLAAVFMLYAHPGLMVRLAEQLWSCFG